MIQEQIEIRTAGRGNTDITAKLQRIVHQGRIETGLAHVFCHHTSASLIIAENADPQVHGDQETFFSRLVPDGDPMFRHRDEGPDDMAAHIRTLLTNTGLTIPVTQNSLALGTWQGIYLWEHRTAPHRRRLTLTVTGKYQDD